MVAANDHRSILKIHPKERGIKMKCFLSHSSADKAHYVRLVADRLRSSVLVYDEYTFEAGMQTAQEILRGLDATDIFVLFLSEKALQSDWVKEEIFQAKNRLDSGDIDRIFPIIIDPSITHRDPRIPNWMREQYNLRLVSRPTQAVRRVNQRIRELSWKKHPRIHDKNTIFVGRNDLIRGFEERIDDFTKNSPSCVVASGLKNIGRRSLLINALAKSNIIEKSYDPLRLHLSQDDGLEGFIVKLHDLGVTEQHDVSNLMQKRVEEKVSLVSEMCLEIVKANDIILIEDDGTVFTYDGSAADWFLALLENIPQDKLLFAVAAKYKVRVVNLRRNERIFSIEVPELNVTERNGLLKRYADMDDLSLTRADSEWVAGLLKGYPDQVFFAVDCIRTDGIERVKNNAHEIVEFNKNRAAIVLRRFEAIPGAVDLLRLLAGFEFISYKLIEELCDPAHMGLIETFVAESICEEIGAAREYIRVNDVIRDYVFRNKMDVSADYKKKLNRHTTEFVNNASGEDDASEYFYFVKAALVEGMDVSEATLIPAHFLATMRELYSDRRYTEVIRICDKVLGNSHSLDKRAEQDIRYYLCQSLARLKNERFLREVQFIDGGEHDFLLGFYYRHQGRYKDAQERLRRAMVSNRAEKRARRELVTVYLMMEALDEALSLARNNYDHFPSNPYLVQAYFNCLIQQPKTEQNRRDLQDLLSALEKINSDKSREMLASAMASMTAIYDGEQERALNIINDAIQVYPGNKYPVLTKIDICCRFNNRDELKRMLDTLRPGAERKASFYNAFKKAEAIFYALSGNENKALHIIQAEMPDFSEAAKARLLDKISQICRPNVD